MSERLSALRAGHPLSSGRFLVPISVRGGVDPRAIVRLEGLGQLSISPLIVGGEHSIVFFPPIMTLTDCFEQHRMKQVYCVMACCKY
jgi:hypothetical protein